MVWMSIQLFVVLSIFSSEKPARSYCQDLIKDLKASSSGGCVLSTVTLGVVFGVVGVITAVASHPVDKYEECDTQR